MKPVKITAEQYRTLLDDTIRTYIFSGMYGKKKRHKPGISKLNIPVKYGRLFLHF
jgi:hypothetical protein